MEYGKGIDLSRYQWLCYPAAHPQAFRIDPTKPAVDFNKIKAAGVLFAWVRATTIDGGVDYAFEENWAGLKSVGISRGAYGFANAKDPVGYAERMYKIVSATGDLGELPPALDFECRYISATKSYIGKMSWQECRIWLLHAEALFQKRPIIYTSMSMWFTPSPAWTSEYELWVASYAAIGNQPKYMPKGWNTWRVWQQGTPAIGESMGVKSKEIDVDVYNGDEYAFNKWAGFKHIQTLEERVFALELAVFGKDGKIDGYRD
jgi:lysozyme